MTINSGLTYLGPVMIRALLTFNPEAHGSGGDKLLFGVAVPPRVRPFALSALGEFNLASQFLEARPGPRMIALLKHIIHRAGTAGGRTVDPRIVGSLLQRLTRAATTVHDALRSESVGIGSPHSPEAIFGTELEGLSPEDQEFETARRFVRFAHEMAGVAARAATGSAPDIVTSRAERITALHLAPGLPRAVAAPPMYFRARRRARLGQ
jgi:hypothetical protein